MLKKLRQKKTAKKVWIVLAILIVPAFLLWGLGGALRSQREPTFAGKIFGKRISSLEYRDALAAVKTKAIIQFGDNLSKLQKYLNLESQAWDRLILLVEAKKRKISVSDQEVIELIKNYPFFQRKGQFDNKVYSQICQYVFGVPTRTFEEQTRQNLILNKLYDILTKDINLSEEEIKEAYRKENEEVSIYYIAGLYADFVKDIATVQQELKDYFAKNSLEFKQPLSFNVEYISLESEDKTKKLFSLLNKKSDFIKTAKDFGLVVKETGLFTQTDPIPGIGWSPEILNLLSKLKINQYPVPIQLDKNYYILRLKERKEAYIPDFEKIKDKVKETFIKNKSKKMAKEKIEECFKKLQELYKLNPKQIDFGNISKTYNLKFDSTNLFKYGSYIEGIGASDNLWLAARGLKENELSAVIDMPVGLYIIKLKDRVPIDEKKFESQKSEFSLRLLTEKKQEYFAKFMEELKRKAQIF